MAQQPPPGNLGQGSLKVDDALGYLDLIKRTFHDQPSIYNEFLEIMKDFKNGHIGTTNVIQRVRV